MYITSERSPSKIVTHCMIPTKWHSGKDKTMETKKRRVVIRDWGEGRDENRGYLGQYSILYYTTVLDTCHYTFVKTQNIQHQKWILISTMNFGW